MVRHLSWATAAAVTATVALTGTLQAQTEPLPVGSVAPDFTLAGGSADGVLPDSVQLSDFQGKTVVLAFFFKARTKG